MVVIYQQYWYTFLIYVEQMLIVLFTSFEVQIFKAWLVIKTLQKIIELYREVQKILPKI